MQRKILLSLLVLCFILVPLVYAWGDDYYSITGTVYDITNNRPLEGATVALFKLKHGWRIEHFVYHCVEITENEKLVIHIVAHMWIGEVDYIEQVGEVLTDQNGQFTFENIEEGDYMLVVAKSEYCTYYTYFKLKQDMIFTIYLLQLQPTYKVTGTVTNSQTSLPVSGASVVITNRYDSGIKWSGITDENGYFMFEVPENDYILSVSHPNYHPYSLQCHIGSDTVLPIYLVPYPTCKVSGTVTNAENGSRISDAYVSLVKGDNAEVCYSTVTDNNGYFILEVVPDNYILYAWKDGYYLYTLYCYIGSDTVIPVQLIPYPVYTLQGHVRDFKNNPIEGAKVCANGNLTLTNSEGYFTYRLPKGTVTLTVEKDGYLPYWASFTLDGATYISVYLVVKEPVWTVSGKVVNNRGEDLSGVQIWLRGTKGQEYFVLSNNRGKFELTVVQDNYTLTASKDGYRNYQASLVVTSDVFVPLTLYPLPIYRLNGTVVDQHNMPISEAIVSVLTENTEVSRLTDNKGYFEFSLWEGDYQFRVSKSGYYDYSAYLPVNKDTYLTITLPPVLKSEVSGRILNSITSEPMEVTVILKSATGEQVVISTGGNFRFTDLSEGTYTLIADSDVTTRYETTFVLKEGEAKFFNIYLRTAYQVKVNICYVDNLKYIVPVEGRQVRIYSSRIEWERLTREAITGSDGNAILFDVVPGDYILEFEDLTYPLRVDNQENVNIAIDILGKYVYSRVYGIITPLGENAHIRLIGSFKTFEGDFENSFEFDYVPTGKYTLEVTHPKYKKITTDIIVTHEPLMIEINLTKGVAIPYSVIVPMAAIGAIMLSGIAYYVIRLR